MLGSELGIKTINTGSLFSKARFALLTDIYFGVFIDGISPYLMDVSMILLTIDSNSFSLLGVACAIEVPMPKYTIIRAIR